MKMVYVVAVGDSPVMAFEDEADASALAEKIGGRASEVMYAEMEFDKKIRLGSLTDEDFAS